MKKKEAIEILEKQVVNENSDYIKNFPIEWINENTQILSDSWYDAEAIDFAIRILKSLEDES